MRAIRARLACRGPPSPDRRAPRERPGAAGAHRGTRERVHDLRSDASRSDTQVNASEVAHHDPTHADHDALETHVARFPIRSSPASPPSPPFPAPLPPQF